MTYKFLLKVFLTSLGSLATLAPLAIAQERPECYIIEDSGQLTDLSDICNVSQQRSPQANSNSSDTNTASNNTNVINLNPISTGGLGLTGTGVFNRSYYDRSLGLDYRPYAGGYSYPTPVVNRTVTKRTYRFYQYPKRPSSTVVPRVFPSIYPY